MAAFSGHGLEHAEMLRALRALRQDCNEPISAAARISAEPDGEGGGGHTGAASMPETYARAMKGLWNPTVLAVFALLAKAAPAGPDSDRATSFAAGASRSPSPG
jgi:hypothetical protein